MIHFHEHIKKILELRKRAEQDKELQKQKKLYLKGKIWRLKKENENSTCNSI